MSKFTTLKSKVLPLAAENVDTDQIIPARYLKVTDKAGLGSALFADWRNNADGTPKADFVVNKPEMQGRAILLAGDNFGCGSSREQAPWALLDLGIRCIIAPGFGEIFAANAISNGLLPVALPASAWQRVLAEAEAGRSLAVSLVLQSIELVNGDTIAFDFDPGARQAMLNGWDDVAMILARHADAIAGFEAAQRQSQPWLWEKNGLREKEPQHG